MSSDASVSPHPISSFAQWFNGVLDWVTRHQVYVLAIGVAFQVVFLVAMMVGPLMTLATGEAILLRVAPVDPRDIFRGDYVTLSYEINRPGWDASQPWDVNWRQSDRIKELQGKAVYVPLEPEADGKHWRSTGYQLDPPTNGKFIRGTVEGRGMVKYGIEQYFIEEGQGRAYEEAVRARKLSAEVILDKNGSAQLKRLIIE